MAAVEPPKGRRVCERPDTLGHEEGRRGGLVVRAGLDEASEEDVRGERGLADLDEAHVVRLREGACSTDPQELAALRLARPREPPRAQPDPGGESFGRGQVDGAAPDGRAAEEHDVDRLAETDRRERLPRDPVELRQGRAALAGDAEPHRPNGPLGRRDRLERTRDAAILGDQAPREDGRERGRGGGETEADERETGGATAQPRTREPERIAEAAQRLHDPNAAIPRG